MGYLQRLIKPDGGPDYYLAGDVSAIIRWNQEITSK